MGSHEGHDIPMRLMNKNFKKETTGSNSAVMSDGLALKVAVKEELPHLKYAYECMLNDGLSIGPLKEIHDRLKTLV